MVFEEIQQRLDQDLEEYKDDEEREHEEKKHHGWFQYGEI